MTAKASKGINLGTCRFEKLGFFLFFENVMPKALVHQQYICDEKLVDVCGENANVFVELKRQCKSALNLVTKADIFPGRAGPLNVAMPIPQ